MRARGARAHVHTHTDFSSCGPLLERCRLKRQMWARARDDSADRGWYGARTQKRQPQRRCAEAANWAREVRHGDECRQRPIGRAPMQACLTASAALRCRQALAAVATATARSLSRTRADTSTRAHAHTKRRPTGAAAPTGTSCVCGVLDARRAARHYRGARGMGAHVSVCVPLCTRGSIKARANTARQSALTAASHAASNCRWAPLRSATPARADLIGRT